MVLGAVTAAAATLGDPARVVLAAATSRIACDLVRTSVNYLPTLHSLIVRVFARLFFVADMPLLPPGAARPPPHGGKLAVLLLLLLLLQVLEVQG